MHIRICIVATRNVCIYINTKFYTHARTYVYMHMNMLFVYILVALNITMLQYVGVCMSAIYIHTYIYNTQIQMDSMHAYMLHQMFANTISSSSNNCEMVPGPDLTLLLKTGTTKTVPAVLPSPALDSQNGS